MNLSSKIIMSFAFFAVGFIVIQLVLLAMRVYKTTQMNRQQRRDQQGNVFTISDEASPNRYNDIFYIEPNSEEAARIRAQLEKDDKELPSYDEVMRMCNLTTPTAAAASGTSTIDMPGSDVAPPTIAALPAVPPYSETDPNPIPGRSVQIEMTSITVPSDSVATPSSQRDISEQTGSLRLTQTVSNSVV